MAKISHYPQLIGMVATCHGHRNGSVARCRNAGTSRCRPGFSLLDLLGDNLVKPGRYHRFKTIFGLLPAGALVSDMLAGFSFDIVNRFHKSSPCRVAGADLSLSVDSMGLIFKYFNAIARDFGIPFRIFTAVAFKVGTVKTAATAAFNECVDSHAIRYSGTFNESYTCNHGHSPSVEPGLFDSMARCNMIKTCWLSDLRSLAASILRAVWRSTGQRKVMFIGLGMGLAFNDLEIIGRQGFVNEIATPDIFGNDISQVVLSSISGIKYSMQVAVISFLDNLNLTHFHVSSL